MTLPSMLLSAAEPGAHRLPEHKLLVAVLQRALQDHDIARRGRRCGAEHVIDLRFGNARLAEIDREQERGGHGQLPGQRPSDRHPASKQGNRRHTAPGGCRGVQLVREGSLGT